MKKSIYILLSILITVMNVFSSTVSVKAAGNSILDAPNVYVPDKDTVISSKYSFIAKFIRGETTIETFGTDKWEVTEENKNGPIKQTSLKNPTDSMKGKVGVTYKNVGTYEGKIVDLKITVLDWQKYFTGNTVFSYGVNSINHTQAGFNFVKQKWEYIYADNGEKVDVTGTYMTFNDIDALQSIQFDKASSSKIAKMFVSADSWVQYYDHNGEIELAAPSNAASNNDDKFAMVTALFDSGEMTFQWKKDYVRNGTSPNYDYSSEWGGSEYFGFLATKPARTETLEPTKLITDSNEKQVESNTLENASESYTYTIYHTVPDEWEDFYYKSYRFEDRLEDALEIKNVEILNDAGEDVSSYFTNTSSGQTVSYTATEAALKSAKFYNNTYQYNITVKVKEGTDISQYLTNDGTIVLKNKATVTIDGDSNTSNETETIIPEIEGVAYKSIVENGSLVENTTLNIGDVIQYRLDFIVPNNQIINQLILTDDLEDVLDLSHTAVFDVAGNDITDQGELVIDEENEIFTWTADNPNDFFGESIYVLIDAQLKANVDLSPYEDEDGNVSIPNQGYMTVNEETHATLFTNFVYASPSKTIQASITKSITDLEGNDVDASKVEIGQEYQYRLSVQAPTNRELNSFVIKDDLEDILDLKNAVVYDSEGNDITDQGELIVDEENEIFTWTANDPISLSGKLLEVDLTFSIKEGADFSNYLADGVISIPNIAQLIINEKSTDSNEVVITPNVENEIKKSVLDGENLTDSLLINNDSQEITFQGEVTVTNQTELSNVSIVDELEAPFSYKELKVYNSLGEEVTEHGTVTIEEQKVVFTFNEDYLAKVSGQTFTLELSVTYDSESDLSAYINGTIPNVMQLVVNEESLDSNKVTVTPNIENEIVKSIVDGENLAESLLINDENQEITFYGKVTVTNLTELSTVAIVDELEAPFSYKELKVYDSLGEDVTEQGMVTTEGQKVVFTFNEDYLEKVSAQTFTLELTVTYDSESDLSNYKGASIPNTLQLVVNDEVTDSNEVVVTPTIENTIVKSIVDDENLVDSMSIDDENQEVTFYGRVLVSNHNELTSVSIVDELEAPFSYKELKVYNSLGEEVTEQGTVTTEGQKVIFTFNEDYLEKVSGQIFTLELTVIYDSEEDLSSYENGTIPNIMQLVVNDEVIDSNEVSVTVSEKPIEQVEEANEEKPQGKLPQTGQSSRLPVILWMTLSLITVVSALVIHNKKQNKEA